MIDSDTDLEVSLPIVNTLQGQCARVENVFDTIMCKKTQKECLRRWGPRLLCTTFVQDSLDMILNFATIINTLSFAWTSPIACSIVFGLASCQLAGAYFLVSRDHFRVKTACYFLAFLVGARPWIFSLSEGLHFVRAITMSGSLFLLASLAIPRDVGRKQDVAGISDAIQLVGRVFMTTLFFVEAIVSEYGGLHGLLVAPSLLGFVGYMALLGASCMVCVGFKTQASALVLAFILLLASLWMYPFWWCAADQRRVLMFLFFQTISITGGLFLLASHGPGGFSVEAALRKQV